MLHAVFLLFFSVCIYALFYCGFLAFSPNNMNNVVIMLRAYKSMTNNSYYTSTIYMY